MGGVRNDPTFQTLVAYMQYLWSRLYIYIYIYITMNLHMQVINILKKQSIMQAKYTLLTSAFFFSQKMSIKITHN